MSHEAEEIICPSCKEWTSRCEPCCPSVPDCDLCLEEDEEAAKDREHDEQCALGYK